MEQIKAIQIPILHIYVYLVLVITVFFPKQFFAQNSHSSEQVIAQQHLEIALEAKETNRNIANANIEEALKIAIVNNDNKIYADTYYTQAKIYDYWQEYDSSSIFYNKAAPYYKKLKDSLFVAKCYINIGATQYYYGAYDDALNTYDNASKYLKNLGDSDLESKVYNNLALINKSLGEYKTAISYFQKVIGIHEINKNEIGIAHTSLNIGIIYWEYKNHNSALKSFSKALKIYQSLDLLADVATSYNNIGLVYSDMDSLDVALEYYEKAYSLNVETNNQIGIGTSLLNKAVLLDKLGEFEISEELFIESLDIFKEKNYHLGIFICKLNLSRMYSQKGQHQHAIDIVLEAFEIQNINHPIRYLSDGYLVLAENYSDLTQFKNANIYYRKYFTIQDSIFNIDMNNQIMELQTKYEFEKTEAQLVIYKKEMQIQDLELKSNEKRIKTTSSILLLSLLFSIIFIILYIQKRKTYLSLVEQNVQLAKSDIEKEKQFNYQDDITDVDTNEKLNSNLSDDQKQVILNKLLVLMEKEKYFMQTQITINDIAKKLNTNRNYLSQFINDHFNTNFNSFLNEYRVKEARKLLLISQYNNYTIEGIAETVGFHSKATFNTYFKKITGVTPSFFRNNTNKITS